MSVVICKLPKAGIGNQLFPLMHSIIFAEINNLPLIITGYYQLKIGPFIRREKTKRNYLGYYNFQKNIGYYIIDLLKIEYFKLRFEQIHEPSISSKKHTENKVYVFHKLPSISDYFIHLRNYRTLTINSFWSILHPGIIKMINNNKWYNIGVHVRMGDFRKLINNEPYIGGHVRTPEKYFIDTINQIRNKLNRDETVAIYTDGYRSEFNELLITSNLVFIEGNPDIVDLVCLSKSKIIITSPSSTFSYWAAFLSDAKIVQHPEIQHPVINKTLNVDLLDNI